MDDNVQFLIYKFLNRGRKTVKFYVKKGYIIQQFIDKCIYL